MQNSLVRNYFYLFLAEFWTLLIAFLCLTSFKKLPSVGVQSADKYVHFTFHFVFTLLWVLYFKNKPSKANTSLRNLAIKMFLVSFLYGIVIEIAQSLFTTTRKGDVMDILANSIGALFAVFAMLLWSHFYLKEYNKMK